MQQYLQQQQQRSNERNSIHTNIGSRRRHHHHQQNTIIYNICYRILKVYNTLRIIVLNCFNTTIWNNLKRIYCRRFNYYHQQQPQSLSSLKPKRTMNMKNATFNYNNNIIRVILILIFVIIIIYQIYIYIIYNYIYQPHYNYYFYEKEQSLRYLRFPSIEQRIQLYMSHWYYNPYIPYCSTTTINNHNYNHTIRTIQYNKKYQMYNDANRNHEEYYYELSIHEQMTRNTTTSLSSTSSSNTMIVQNHIEIGTILNINYYNHYYISLYQCYKNTTLNIHYYCRDILESILYIYYHIPIYIIRTIFKYDILFYYILVPYIKHIHHNNNIYNKKNNDNDNSMNEFNFNIPLLVQFSDETDSFIYQKDTTNININNINNNQNSNNHKSTTRIMNPYLPHIKKIRHALPKHIIDHIMTRTINQHYSIKIPSSSSSSSSIYYNNNNYKQNRNYYNFKKNYKLQHPSCYKHNPFIQHYTNQNNQYDTNQQQQIMTTTTQNIEPIIWLLNSNRHFKYTKDINQYDIPYHQKINGTIFRGMLTGPDIPIIPNQYNTTNNNINTQDDNNTTILINQCLSIPRCRLVYNMYNSTLVNAKITDTLNKVPNIINNRTMIGTHLLKEEILQYKGIIILEGNDVSSGLKWAMVSNSVVLMCTPKYTSYAMEELLEPYIHYIPINHNLSNIEEQTLWMIQHPYDVQRIIHRAKLWILDLYYHPNAIIDQYIIYHEILLRYQQHFITSSNNNNDKNDEEEDEDI